MANKPFTYIPSFLQTALSGNKPVQLTFADVRDTNIASTSSFIYDPPGSPLKSTQQLNVDWSRFENHTFFMSAEAKTNLAFDQIINGYPFDGTRAENEHFFEGMTGFDKWVFDSFPKYRGELHLSGTQVGEDIDGTAGTWIQVKDYVGALYPELSRHVTGESVLNPKSGSSMTIDMQLHVPAGTTPGNQIICQKISGSTQGFALYMMMTGSADLADVRFSVFSGSRAFTTQYPIEKGTFNNISVELNRDTGTHYLSFYLNGDLVDTSKTSQHIDDMSIDASDFFIGSGSAFNIGGTVITPTQTLSGTLDELRLFHSARSTAQLQQYSRRSMFASPDLKLYYRFNEPQPPLVASDTDTTNAIVIDSSGNALHALINNFFSFVNTDVTGTITSSQLRIDTSTDVNSRMLYESNETAPVLFPAHSGVINLNSDLLTSASAYDSENPNLITRLIPQHYLLEGAAFEGFQTTDGNIGDQYTGGIAGQGVKGGTQMLISMLYIFARFFDEMKLFVDAFANLRHVNYNTNNTVPNNFILELIRQYGFNLPPLFNDSTLEQYVRAENIDHDVSTSTYSLRYVQNELMRRVLINLPDVIKSKGTQHSIKAFLRAVGIDPENSLRIREYGGPTSRQLTYTRETKREPNLMLQMGTGSLVVSPYLSASRLEPGTPEIAGTFVQQKLFPPNGMSDDPNDGLLTSGSWTVEFITKFTPAQIAAMTETTQSLMRMMVTGSNASEGGIIANVLAMSSSIDPHVQLYVRPGMDSSAPLLSMKVPMSDKGIFDGSFWNVSFGVERNDSINSFVSSSYFLRVGRSAEGQIDQAVVTSSFFNESTLIDANALHHLTSGTYHNASGTYLAVGTNQVLHTGAAGTYAYLNDTTIAPDDARMTSFSGLLSNVRFWSKALSVSEWNEHVRNYKSFGVLDPSMNYNYNTTSSGSFEKLRLDAITKQDTVQADATSSIGSITFLDFSQNGNHLIGSGFPIEQDLLQVHLFDYSYPSPNFDEASSSEKIRIRGLKSLKKLAEHPWIQPAPVYEIVKSEEPTDDVRFSIDFSLIDALNRDIMLIFATLDELDNALGNPELAFSPDYPDLERLRDVYFNRLSNKLNFKAFFEYFRWFDTSIGTFIKQLIPRKTNFRGTNFVIESHVLERHKVEYNNADMYVDEANRKNIRSVLLLQQIAGKLRKY